MDIENELESLKLIREDIKIAKLLGFSLTSAMKKQLTDEECKFSNLLEQINLFIERFSDSGWCISGSMDSSLIENVNKEFEKNGFAAAEQILLSFHRNDIKTHIMWLRGVSDELDDRHELIEKAFKEHFEGRYFSSVPLFLIIIDGAVNDFTKRQGFFATKTDMSAWDCVEGCYDALGKQKDIFNKARKKTTTEEIRLPYRNGILHGRDLNYGNEYVSCKCVALLFVIRDWIKMKNSEEERKFEYNKKISPPSPHELFTKFSHIKKVGKEITEWKKKEVVVGVDIPSNGAEEAYTEYLYLIPIIKLFDLWSKKNYRALSLVLKKIFWNEKSDSERTKMCKELFATKHLKSYEIIEVEEKACSLTRVLTRAKWICDEKEIEEQLEFGCCYVSFDKDVIAVPWMNKGEWVLNPWNVRDCTG